MERKVKVNIFLGIVIVLAILFAIFAFRSHSSDADYQGSKKEYEDTIKVLNDTIKTLKQDIAKYQEEIKNIDLERKSIQEELKLIIKDGKKIDSELANGDWDTNIKFLTDFLSKEDSVGDGHSTSDN